MNREQAINYLISSGFTHEQVGEVVRALTYEPTTKNDPKFCPDRKAKTTNMETILHCIENECAAYKDGKCLKYNSDQEPTTKNDSSELEKNSKKLEKDFGELDCISRADAIKAMQNKAKKLTNEDTINGLCGAVAILFELPSVTPQEKTGHWIDNECTNCGYEVQPWNNTNYCPNCGAKMVELQESEE